jgi:hypothetical protein
MEAGSDTRDARHVTIVGRRCTVTVLLVILCHAAAWAQGQD